MLPKPQPKPQPVNAEAEALQAEWLRNQTTVYHIADLHNKADAALDLLLNNYKTLTETEVKCGLNTIATIRSTIVCLQKTLQSNPTTHNSHKLPTTLA